MNAQENTVFSGQERDWIGEKKLFSLHLNLFKYFPQVPLAGWTPGKDVHDLPLVATIGCRYECYTAYIGIEYTDGETLWQRVCQCATRTSCTTPARACTWKAIPKPRARRWPSTITCRGSRGLPCPGRLRLCPARYGQRPVRRLVLWPLGQGDQAGGQSVRCAHTAANVAGRPAHCRRPVNAPCRSIRCWPTSCCGCRWQQQPVSFASRI